MYFHFGRACNTRPSRPIRPSDALKPRCSPHWRPRALPANPNPTPNAHRIPEKPTKTPSQHARLACVACNKSPHTPTLITAAAARACSVPPVHTRTQLSRVCRVRRSPVLRADHPVRLHGGGGGRHGQLAAGWLPQVAKTGEQWRWRRLAREALATGRGPRRFWREWHACVAVAPRATRPLAHAARCRVQPCAWLVGGREAWRLGSCVRSFQRPSQPFSTASAREPPARMAGVQVHACRKGGERMHVTRGNKCRAAARSAFLRMRACVEPVSLPVRI